MLRRFEDLVFLFTDQAAFWLRASPINDETIPRSSVTSSRVCASGVGDIALDDLGIEVLSGTEVRSGGEDQSWTDDRSWFEVQIGGICCVWVVPVIPSVPVVPTGKVSVLELDPIGSELLIPNGTVPIV
ncbi:hypothetical protein DY000_02022056 [Brassica cretica]|uniref:Uncharacterized protein n=1 Tax=Brassica cretica TaxID=69181 RepID=A0ABQ7EBV6_BRACR|nr:hypothetical protein DY000_02022056 [Brassica cretica]